MSKYRTEIGNPVSNTLATAAETAAGVYIAGKIIEAATDNKKCSCSGNCSCNKGVSNAAPYQSAGCDCC